MLRGVPLYNFSGERVLETLQPVQVRRVICLQFNDISIFNSALEKLEHLQKHITHEFGTCHGMSCQEFFVGTEISSLWKTTQTTTQQNLKTLHDILKIQRNNMMTKTLKAHKLGKVYTNHQTTPRMDQHVSACAKPSS